MNCEIAAFPNLWAADFSNRRVNLRYGLLDRDLAGLIRLGRVHAPHHAAVGHLDIFRLELGEFRVRPQPSVHRGEEELTKSFIGRLVQRLLVLGG